jgi:hypothetical protein
MGNVACIIRLIQNTSGSKALSLARLLEKIGRKGKKKGRDHFKGQGNLSRQK